MAASFPTTGETPWWADMRSYLNELKGVWNVVDYGAVADNTTNNTTAINNAITAANTAGGGTVLIPAAGPTFATGSAIVMKANVQLLLMGTVKALASHAGVGVDITNVSNVGIVGPGTIDMNKAATTSSGGATAQHPISVNVTGVSTVAGVTIRDVTVQNSWQDGIMFSSVSGAKFTDVAIEKVTVSSTGTEGIDFRGIGDTAVAAGISTCQRIMVRGCTITNPGTSGIRCRGISDVTIAYNVITDSGSATGHGICMGAGSGGVTDDQATDFSLTNNKVRGFAAASQWGIVLSARCTRFEVIGNTVRSCTNGISADVKDPNNTSTLIDVDGSFVGNKVLACGGLSAGIRANQAKNLAITGNVVRGCTAAGYGLAINNSLALVATGNVVTGGAGDGIVVGVVGGVLAGTGNHTIKGNRSTGNTGNQYRMDTAVPLTSSLDADLGDSALAEVTVSNTVTETQVFATTIPGNVCQAGTTFRVSASFLVDNILTSGTLTIRLKWGGIGGSFLAGPQIPSSGTANTGQRVSFIGDVTIRSVGAAGSAICGGNFRSDFSAYSQGLGGGAVAVDTTVDKVLYMSAQWATANVGNVCKLETAVLTVVKS